LDIPDLHKGVGINFQFRDKSFPTEGSRRFVISKVITLDSVNQICLQIELQCLDSTAFVDFESFYPKIGDMELIMNFDDPYVIDDDTIDWFKNADMLDSVKLKRLINYVIDDNPSHFEQEKVRVRNLSRSSRTFSAQDMDAKATTPAKMEMDEIKKTSEHETLKDPLLQFKTEYLLKFNPYAHRCDVIVIAHLACDLTLFLEHSWCSLRFFLIAPKRTVASSVQLVQSFLWTCLL